MRTLELRRCLLPTVLLLSACAVGCGSSDGDAAVVDDSPGGSRDASLDQADGASDAGRADVSVDAPEAAAEAGGDAAPDVASDADDESATGADASDADGAEDGDATVPDDADAANSDDAGADADGDAAIGPTVIYVSQTSGDDAKDGTTTTSPVRSIARGIALAAACLPAPCEVHVAAGTYDEAHTLTMVSGVNLLGGYKATDWTRTLGANAVAISTKDPVVIKADTLTLPTSIDKVLIKGTNVTQAGAATFAVQVSNTNELAITNSLINGGNGARGADGTPGGILSCSAGGGGGGHASDCSSASGGAGTTVGSAKGGSSGGGGGSTCPSSCPQVGHDGIGDGDRGGKGDDGASAGSIGAVTDGFGRFTGVSWLPVVAADGKSGTTGAGGGGGGSGGTKKIRSCFGCGTQYGGAGGDGGKGGCAGGGGLAGTQGGGSFGIVAYNATVDLTGTTIIRGSGGAGGNGGNGSLGQTGTGGSPGASGDNEKCGAIRYYAGDGGPGGNGGSGGGGGGAAPGNGGPSVGVVTVGTSTITGAPTILGGAAGEPGKPGVGGANGFGGKAPDGPPGVPGVVSETCGAGPGC